MDINKFIEDNLDELIEDPDGFLHKALTINNSSSNPENEDNQEDDFVSELHQNYFDKTIGKNLEQISGNIIKIPNTGKNKKLNKIIETDENTDNIHIQSDNESNKSTKSDESDNESEESYDLNGRFIEPENIDNKDNYNEHENIEPDNNPDTDTKFYFGLMNIFMKYYNEKFEKQHNFFSGIKDFQKDTSNPMELFFDAIIEFKMLKENIVNGLPENDEVRDSDDSITTMAMKFYFNSDQKQKITNLFEMWEGQIYCLEYGPSKIISPSLIVCLNYIMVNELVNNEWTIFNLKDN